MVSLRPISGTKEPRVTLVSVLGVGARLSTHPLDPRLVRIFDEREERTKTPDLGKPHHRYN